MRWSEIGKMSKGNNPPAKKLTSMKKINRGAQTSGLQKEIMPRSVPMKKLIITARKTAKTLSNNVVGCDCKKIGGCKMKYTIVSSATAKLILTNLSPISRANQYPRYFIGLIRNWDNSPLFILSPISCVFVEKTMLPTSDAPNTYVKRRDRE